MQSFERMHTYVDILDSLRKGHRLLPAGDFLTAFQDIPPKLVRADFAGMGITIAGTHVDLNAAYWRAKAARGRAEADTLASIAVDLELPTAADILADLRSIRTRADPVVEGGDAARVADAAADVASESEHFLLGHGRMADQYVAFRHQVETARRVAYDRYGSAIVADEVGLGKTVVAGLLIEDVLAHDANAAVLILVPPNLREQWGEKELPQFFRRPVRWSWGACAPEAAVRGQIVLLSIDAAKGVNQGPRRALTTALLERTWDLLIVDEAHDCRNPESLRFQFVYSLKARRRVFLTATPIQNSGYDMFALATLLRPGVLGRKQDFSEQYMEGERTLADASALQRTLAPLMTRTRRAESGLPFAARRLRSIAIQEFADEERDLYTELLEILRGIYRRHMSTAVPVQVPSGASAYISQFVLTAMLVLREMASHPLSAIQTLRTALRGRVKALSDLTYDTTDLAKLDSFIAQYESQSWEPDHHAKSHRLVEETDRLLRAGRKFIVYVNYLETHKKLTELLRQRHPDLTVLSYEGSMAPRHKRHVIGLFDDPTVRSCLVSTDAGGQGLNLQVADTLVNYDMPWNPMRVEQRVGRIDRVTQRSRTIDILNFLTRGTVEEYIQIVLTKKLKECTSVLGDFESPFLVEKVYEDRLTMGIGTALMESADAEDMRQRMQKLGVDDLRRYVGEYDEYAELAPASWTWHAQS
jgi:superfamily II DNA or RNA helicase